MRTNICLAALAATFVAATPAFAQAVTDTAQSVAHGRVLESHTLTNSSELDFGTVAASASAGSVVVAATALGTRSATGGVTLVPSTSSSARFDGLGAPGETILLTLNQPVGGVLQSAAGDQITGVLALDAGGATRTADANGVFTVYVGGDFGISANQPNGYYTADFSLTAEYQ